MENYFGYMTEKSITEASAFMMQRNIEPRNLNLCLVEEFLMMQIL